MGNLIKIIQHFVSLESVGQSAVRNQGKGTLKSVRKYLANIDLSKIPDNPIKFKSWLDKQTTRMLDSIEEITKHRPWGTARKALNLFLRTCLYNYYLRKEYKLARLEKLLEIPLDSVVATALIKEARKNGEELPRWPNLKTLTPSISDQYQRFARTLASLTKTPARVHLDVILWTKNR